jgi:uncharacterized protein (DUF1330 family)
MFMQKGYILSDLDITYARHFYDEYMPCVRPVLDKYQAKFLIANDAPEVIEGDRVVKRIVFIEVESPACAREFYHSKDYQDAIGYRFDSANTHLYILDGVPTTA